jgi:transaldolase
LVESVFKGRIKIFGDTSDLAQILELAQKPEIAGFTTNPTLMRAAGVSDYEGFCRSILEHVQDKPISFEVFADDFAEMRRQARKIAAWGSNVYVKIPVTDSRGNATTDVVHDLSHDGLHINVTALCTFDQVVRVSQALRGGARSVVSLFAGRIADTGRDPALAAHAAVQACAAADRSIELLWASCREILNVVQAEHSGCAIVTVTPHLLAKMNLFDRDLALMSLDTVRMFKDDAEAAGYSL